MAATTYLQVVNRVLTRLRESTVATVTETAYSTLIGSLVNRVKTEIEDAWRWHALRDTYSVTCVSGTTAYVLTNSGPDAIITDAWNTSVPGMMRPSTVSAMNARFFGVNSVVIGHPEEYVIGGLDANHDISIDVWPSPQTLDVLKFNLYIPQGELSSELDVPRVPVVPLVEGTIARAMAERGDDGGVALQAQEQLYRDLLASAVARDSGRDETEVMWTVA